MRGANCIFSKFKKRQVNLLLCYYIGFVMVVCTVTDTRLVSMLIAAFFLLPVYNAVVAL